MTTKDIDDKGGGVAESRISRQRSGAFRWACALQIMTIIVLLFGDIGFDRPSRFGLDFGHLLLLLVIDGILIAWAATIAIKT